MHIEDIQKLVIEESEMLKVVYCVWCIGSGDSGNNRARDITARICPRKP